MDRWGSGGYVFHPRFGQQESIKTLGVAVLLLVFSMVGSHVLGSASPYAVTIDLLQLPLVLLLVFNEVLPLFRTRVYVDRYALHGKINGASFYIHWENILIARLMGSARSEHQALLLVTKSGPVELPLYMLEAGLLWKKVQSYVNPNALREAPFKEWLGTQPAYRTYLARYWRQIEIQEHAGRVHVRPSWVVYALSAIILLILSLLAFLLWYVNPQDPWFYLLLAFISYRLLGLVFSETITVDSEGISCGTLLGRTHMHWHEVTRIDFTVDEEWMVIYGRHKHMALIGPLYWGGREKLTALLCLKNQMEYRKIPQRVSNLCLLVFFSWRSWQ